jgi:hypothetical protein
MSCFYQCVLVKVMRVSYLKIKRKNSASSQDLALLLRLVQQHRLNPIIPWKKTTKSTRYDNITKHYSAVAEQENWLKHSTLLLVVAIRWKDTVLSHQQQRKTLHMTTWKHTPNQWSLLLTQSFFLSPKIEECSVSSTTENIITEIWISNILLLLFQFSPTAAAASYSSSYFLVATRESSSNCAARQQQLWRRQRRRDRTRPSMESRRRRLHFIHLYRFCHLLRRHSRPPTAKDSRIMSSIL